MHPPITAALDTLGSVKRAAVSYLSMPESRTSIAVDDRFRQAMASSGIGMAIVGLDRTWLEVNPALCALLGYREDELLGHRYDENTDADARLHDEQVVAGLLDGSLSQLDETLRWHRPDGHDVWTQVNVSVIRAPDGAPLSLFAQLRDISRERDASVRLRGEMVTQARQLQQFTDAVAHDLRAPLRAIEGFSRRLADRVSDRLDATDRDHLDRILAGAQRMGGLLDALNDYVHASRAELHPSLVDLSLLADWVGAELQDLQPARAAHIEIQPGLLAWGDERLLKLLLTALLRNCWAFADPDAPVSIRVSGERVDEYMRLRVRDEGIGFDPRYGHKLFEPFQRLHGPEQGAGSGLGLATAERIAQRHGGRLSAESAPDAGSTFTLELPALPASYETA